MTSFRNLISTVCLSMALVAGAQAPVVSFRVTGTPDGIPVTISLRPVGDDNPKAAVTLSAPSADGVYSSPITPSPSELYYLYAYNVEATFQTQMPVYIPDSVLRSGKPVQLTVRDGVLLDCGIGDAPNRDIYACAANFIRQSRTMSDWALSPDTTVLLSHLRSYNAVADSALRSAPVPAQVADFIRLWAYSTASDAYRLVVHLRQRADMRTPISTDAFLPAPRTVLDNDLATTFGATTANIARTLRGSIPEKMAQLYSEYSNPAIRAKVADALLDSYVRTYNYTDGIQPGLNLLADLQERYGVSSRWADQLRTQQATVPGSPFPAGVTLVDTEGNVVPFSKFLGKWVYIDLWASWCGPCVREIPHLKELEKALGDAPVTFLSISVDSSRDAWLKKVAALELHGNQLLDSDGNLAKALNVSGIPHFLLYAPDGKLSIYKASRPSAPETLDTLRALKI